MMQPTSMYAWSNRWFRWSVSGLVVFAVVTLLVGFVWLPSVQGDFTAKGLWDGICRAAGAPRETTPFRALQQPGGGRGG